MPDKPIIDIYSTQQLMIYGRDLRRVRYSSGLIRKTVCDLMKKKGYAYYGVKLFRMEAMSRIYIDPEELMALIECLGIDFRTH